MKREGVSTFFIRSYLWDFSCLLDHLLLFEKCACGVGFECILKACLCNDSRIIRTHTKCCLENSSKKCLCNVFLKVILKRVSL